MSVFATPPSIVTKEYDPPVTFRRLKLDFNDLVDVFFSQIIKVAQSEPSSVHYANPKFIVSCSIPTKTFYNEVQRRQAQWCKVAREAFGRQPIKSASEWLIDPRYKRDSRKERKYRQFMEYTVHVTGFLVIDEQLIPPQQWPKAVKIRQD